MMIGGPRFSRQFLLRRLMRSCSRERRRNSSTKARPSARGVTMLGSVVRGSQSAQSLLSRDDTTVLGGEPMAILVTCKRTPNTPACSTGRSPPGHRVETRSRLRSNAPNSWRQYPGYNHSISPSQITALAKGAALQLLSTECLRCASCWRFRSSGLSAQQSTNPVCLEV